MEYFILLNCVFLDDRYLARYVSLNTCNMSGSVVHVCYSSDSMKSWWVTWIWELLHTKDGQKNVGVCQCVRVFPWIDYICRWFNEHTTLSCHWHISCALAQIHCGIGWKIIVSICILFESPCMYHAYVISILHYIRKEGWEC